MVLFALLREELRAMPRGKFSLLAAGITLTLLALIAATAGMMPLDGNFMLPVFGFAPAILLPIAATSFSHARKSRFLHGVFTSPVTASDYFVAKTAALLLMGLAYIVCAALFLPVALAHLGANALDWRYLVLGVGTMFHAVCVGALLGVLITSRGTLASVALAGVWTAVGLAGLIFLQPLALMPGGVGRDLLLRLAHVSGPVLLHDALGLEMGVRSTATVASWFGFAVASLGSLAVAWWAFTRRQTAEGWTRQGPGPLVAGVVLLVLLLPAAVAGSTYARVENLEEPFSSGASGIHLGVVPRGTPTPDSFPWLTPPVIEAGRPNELDLYVFLAPRNTAGTFERIVLELSGVHLTVAPADVDLTPSVALPKMRPHDHSEAEWPYVQIAVTLTPSAPTSLRENEHHLIVNATLTLVGGGTAEGTGSRAIHSEVPNAPLQMALVGAPMPLLAFSAHALRRWRMR